MDLVVGRAGWGTEFELQARFILMYDVLSSSADISYEEHESIRQMTALIVVARGGRWAGLPMISVTRHGLMSATMSSVHLYSHAFILASGSLSSSVLPT